MEAVFLRVLEISVMVSYLIVAVLLIRGCFRKASASFKCVLWMLVGIRLLLPVNISTPFGLVPNVELSGRQQETEEIYHSDIQSSQGEFSAQGETAGIPEGFRTQTGMNENWLQPTMGGSDGYNNMAWNKEENQEIYVQTENEMNESTQKPGDVVTLWDRAVSVAGTIWIIGMVIMLGYMLFSWLRLHNSLRTAIPEMVTYDGREVKVYRAENISSPFLLGMISPKIYLPYTIKEVEAEYVLAHELMHMRRKDYLLKPLSFLILSLYWFNPFIWVAYVLFIRDVELACDEQVLRNKPALDRTGYAQTLLSCGDRHRRISVCPVAFGESDVKRRVKNVFNYRKPGFWIVLVCVLLCAVVVLCFMTVSEGTAEEGNVVEAQDEGSQEEDLRKESEQIPTATPTESPATTPTVEPTLTPTVKPTVTPTAKPTVAPTPEATPLPTIVPEDWVPAPIEGYTESESQWIREELQKRIVYKMPGSYNTVSIWLDSTDSETGKSLSSIFLPEGTEFQSLDITNEILSIQRDGENWLAVTIKANVQMDGVVFLYEKSVLEVLIKVKRNTDHSILLDSFDVISSLKYRNPINDITYYEENNYTRMQINVLKADVTHDGIDDYIETYMYLEPEADINTELELLMQKHMNHDAVCVSVYDGSTAAGDDLGTCLSTGSYSKVHVGNGQISLVYRDGLAYLLGSSLYAGQGYQTYMYHVYSLDGEGRSYDKEWYSDGFYEADYSIEERKKFADSFKEGLMPWLEDGQLIVGTDLSVGMVSTEEKQYAPQDFYDFLLK